MENETVRTCRPGLLFPKPPVKKVKVGVETLAYRFENGLDLWTGEPLQTSLERWENDGSPIETDGPMTINTESDAYKYHVRKMK